MDSYSKMYDVTKGYVHRSYKSITSLSICAYDNSPQRMTFVLDRRASTGEVKAEEVDTSYVGWKNPLICSSRSVS